MFQHHLRVDTRKILKEVVRALKKDYHAEGFPHIVGTVSYDGSADLEVVYMRFPKRSVVRTEEGYEIIIPIEKSSSPEDITKRILNSIGG